MTDASTLTILPVTHAGSLPVPASTDDELLSTTFRVGARHRVTLSYPGTAAEGLLTVTWHPSQPRRLSARRVAQYRRARDEFFKELSRQLGRPITLCEVER